MVTRLVYQALFFCFLLHLESGTQRALYFVLCHFVHLRLGDVSSHALADPRGLDDAGREIARRGCVLCARPPGVIGRLGPGRMDPRKPQSDTLSESIAALVTDCFSSVARN